MAMAEIAEELLAWLNPNQILVYKIKSLYLLVMKNQCVLSKRHGQTDSFASENNYARQHQD